MFFIKNLAVSLILLALLFLGVASFELKTKAAGMSISVFPESTNVSTVSGFVFFLNTTTNITTSDYIDLFYPNTYSGVLTNLNTNVNGSPAGSVTNTVIGSEIRARIVPTTTILAGVMNISTSVLSSPATAGNYSFRIVTSGNDFGATLQYVGQANVVLVRGLVRPTLSFAIRNSADTANTNLCNMGTLSTASVSSCSYRLKVATNAGSGYTVLVNTSGNFTNGSKTFTNAAVGTGGAGGTNIVSGSERYGVNITKGSVTTVAGTTTLANAYNAGVTNSVSYVNTVAATLMTANRPNNPTGTDTTNTMLVNHRAAISQDTAAGTYNQSVVYTITPSF